jgi:hypothetical protein
VAARGARDEVGVHDIVYDAREVTHGERARARGSD